MNNNRMSQVIAGHIVVGPAPSPRKVRENKRMSFAEAINAEYEEERQAAADIKDQEELKAAALKAEDERKAEALKAEVEREANIIKGLVIRKAIVLREVEEAKGAYQEKIAEAAAVKDELNSVLRAKQMVNVKFYCLKCNRLLETSIQSYSTKIAKAPRDINRAYFGTKPCADCVRKEEVAKEVKEAKKAARVERFGPLFAGFIELLYNALHPK